MYAGGWPGGGAGWQQQPQQPQSQYAFPNNGMGYPYSGYGAVPPQQGHMQPGYGQSQFQSYGQEPQDGVGSGFGNGNPNQPRFGSAGKQRGVRRNSAELRGGLFEEVLDVDSGFPPIPGAARPGGREGGSRGSAGSSVDDEARQKAAALKAKLMKQRLQQQRQNQTQAQQARWLEEWQLKQKKDALEVPPHATVYPNPMSQYASPSSWTGNRGERKDAAGRCGESQGAKTDQRPSE